jgi:hypothetical protein
MDRRKFLKAGSSSLAIGALGLSAPASALLRCGPFNVYGERICKAGISSAIADIGINKPQFKSQWCWAACIEMVFEYYGLYVPQSVIVEQTWGQIINMPAQPGEILQNLNRNWIDALGRRFYVQSNLFTVSFAQASQDLSNNMPLIIGTQGHAMVLTSLDYVVDQYGNGQVLNAIVRDPWPDQGRRSLSVSEWNDVSFLARIRLAKY